MKSYGNPKELLRESGASKPGLASVAAVGGRGQGQRASRAAREQLPLWEAPWGSRALRLLAGFGLAWLDSGLILAFTYYDFDWIWVDLVDFGLDFAVSLAFTMIFAYSGPAEALIAL